MKLVADTSPLIFLSKLNKLDYLLEHKLYIPTQVVKEIEQGKQQDPTNYLFNDPNWHVEDVKIIPNLPRNLGDGEKAAISLAVQKKINTILIDEAQARRVARLFGLQPRGTIGVIFEQCQQKNITKAECRELIFRLVDIGYRISEELLVQILRGLE